MQNKICPNYTGCQIINVDGFVKNEKIKIFYISEFCKSDSGYWQNCKRFQTKNELNLCPDFVMPDTKLTIDEILDKLENN